MFNPSGSVVQPILFKSEDTLGFALGELEELESAQPIVIRRGAGGFVYWHLCAAEDVAFALHSHAPDTTLGQALDLGEAPALETFDDSAQSFDGGGWDPILLLHGDEVAGLWLPDRGGPQMPST